MNKHNRSALINLRHILYDITGNIFVYCVCHILFSHLIGQYNISIRNTLIASLLYLVMFILCSNAMKLYDTSIFYYPDRVTKIVVSSCILSSASVAAIFYFLGRAYVNRYFYLVFFSMSVFAHLLAAYLSFKKNRNHSQNMRTLMIGYKAEFEIFNKYLGKTNMPAYCVGYMLLSDKNISADDKSSYLGFVSRGDLQKVLTECIVDQVYIMCELEEIHSMQKCVDACMELGIITRIILPSYNGRPSFISSVGTYPVISYHLGNMNILGQAVKRVVDIAGAAVGILLSAPIILVAAIAIKMDSQGPVIFSQVRVGRNGRRFNIYKLRTMSVNAEEQKYELLALNEMNSAYIFKIEKDPRVTKVGTFLRKTSIDELPQFINVLLGDMSLVGTRPPTEDEVSNYECNHWQRLRTKPGITGMWQISGRNEITNFCDIVNLDREYIESWSLLLDIKILLKTVVIVLKRKGAS